MKRFRPTIAVNKNTPCVYETFSPIGNVKALDTADVTPGALRDADILIVRSETRVDRDLLEGSAVRFVGTVTIGTDHVDLEYLRSRGIAFAAAPGSNANSVAEYVAAALLEWASHRRVRLAGKTIGVVGVGNVGMRVVQMARALGMTPLLNDPPLARKTGDPAFRPLDEVVNADVVTVHVPLTREGRDATYHLFDRDRFAALRKDALFMNTARGAVADTTAIADWLANNPEAAAVLDVWEDEPAIDLRLLDHVFIGTPHIAGYSLDGKLNALQMVYEAVCRYQGIPPTGFEARASLERLKMSVPAGVAGESEDILRYVIRHTYDIREDHAALRRLKEQPERDRAAFFRRLRASYRTRREFQNWLVKLRGAHASVADTLEALGFSVRVEEKHHV